jgi:ArsR family transcriptional regulator, lead/cadmium/zinc/bismuth-responsive transcriptional repressor
MASTTAAPAPSAASNRRGAADACDVFHASSAAVAALRKALVPLPLVGTLAETFRALGDPTRLRIVDALSHAELCVCDIAALLGLTESAVSHQLRLLRSLRLVRARREGRMVFYALDDGHIARLLAQGREHVEEGLPAGRAGASRRGRS